MSERSDAAVKAMGEDFPASEAGLLILGVPAVEFSKEELIGFIAASDKRHRATTKEALAMIAGIEGRMA